MEIIIKILITIFVTVTIGGCDSLPLPPAQLEFKNKIEALQTEYDQAKNSGNSLFERQAEEKAANFLKKTPHKAVEWVAVVYSIGDDKLTVSTKSDPYTFHLQLFTPEAVTLARSLEQGHKIKFSGDIGAETSMIFGESIGNPQFNFYPESIENWEGSQVAKQDVQYTTATAIKKLQGEEKCKLDLECWADLHLKTATAQCQVPIVKMAKYNHKWTNGILEPKFSRRKWFDADRLHISYSGDKITLQNGYDVWENQKYACVFDTLNNIVIKVGILPGGF